MTSPSTKQSTIATGLASQNEKPAFIMMATVYAPTPINPAWQRDLEASVADSQVKPHCSDDVDKPQRQQIEPVRLEQRRRDRQCGDGNRERPDAVSTSSDLPFLRCAGQTVWLDQNHGEKQQQRDTILVRWRDVGARQIFEHTDQHTAQQCTARIVETADDRRKRTPSARCCHPYRTWRDRSA